MVTLSFEQAKQYIFQRLEREFSPDFLCYGIAHTRDGVVPAVQMLASTQGVGAIHFTPYGH